jgi:hypothetical protein
MFSTDNEELMGSTSGSPWTLGCQALDFENECLGSFFSVLIAPSANIDILKMGILNLLPSKARNLGTSLISTDLELWKLSTSISTKNATIKRAFINLDFSDPEPDDENPNPAREVQRLNPTHVISACWDEEPPRQCVSLVVRVPKVDVGADLSILT